MKHGDFIKIDFVGRIAGTGEIFDFTDEEAAKKEGIKAKGSRGPALVILGDKMVIPGVEKRLLEMKPGENRGFTVPKDEAFGPRNPKLVRILPLSAFLKKNVNPSPGAFVEVDGMEGRVQGVSGGRVRVDFNHPLAGKDLEYDVKIKKLIEDPQEKLNELFMHYGLKQTPKLEGSVLKVESVEEVPHQVKDFIKEVTKKWVKEAERVEFPASVKK